VIKDQEDIIEDYKWEISRKEFLKSLLVMGVAANIPFLTSCETKEDPEFFDCTPLSPEHLKVLQAVQLVLFPKEGNGPSALEVNADKWIVYVLNDAIEPQREKDFIVEHLEGLNQLSKETHKVSYDLLSMDRQGDLLELFFEEKAPKRWGSRMLTLIFEALLLDPLYGVNPNNIGWKWLNHNPGMPRPNEKNMYPTIYATMNEV
jgi:gluconate 2-dehydrogenase gamma chain